MRDLRISTRAQQDEYKVQPEDADVVGGNMNVREGQEVVVDHSGEVAQEGLSIVKENDGEMSHET